MKKTLGVLNYKPLLYTGLSVVLATILICYVMAISLQHLPPWLPTISKCGELDPERHFFRWGFVVGGLFLVLEAVVLWVAKRISTLVFSLGFLAGFALSFVAVVASNEESSIHYGQLVYIETN